MKTTTSKNTHMIIYREGTPTRYRWKRTLLVGDHFSLGDERKKIERMGYHVLMSKFEIASSGVPVPIHGMPETYSPEYPLEDVLENAWSGDWLADKASYEKWAK
jgi:hypothetical protein